MSSKRPSVRLGAKLEKQRRQLGVKQYELAAHLGVDSAVVNRILRGKSDPHIDRLAALAKLLGGRVEIVFPESGE